MMFKRFDRVRASGSNAVGIVEEVVEDTVLVKYPDDRKAKYKEGELEKVEPLEIRLTSEKFDNEVEAVITEIATEGYEKMSQKELEYILNIVVMVSARFRQGFFNEVI